MKPHLWIAVGAIFGGLAVVMGAFGAHALEEILAPQQLSDEQFDSRASNLEVAARYQMYHALALVGIGIMATRKEGRILHVAAGLMTFGVIVFSGCLYGIVNGCFPFRI